jgi:tetratricopeptide (TPR) repeat protein
MPTAPNPPAIKLLSLAARAMGEGRFDEAETHLTAALAHDPANPTALHHLALRAWLRGHTADARHLLERALQTAPNDIPILTSTATMLHETGQPQQALELFLRILAQDNAQADIWNAAGICFQETFQPASAIEFYLRALALRPDFAEAHSNLGAVLTNEGELDAAIEHLHHALRLNPAFADAHHNLGIALRARFQYAAALASLNEADRLAPNHPDILASLGELLSLLDETAAEPTLRRALELRPDDPEKHWNLALELLKRGDYANGWLAYEWRWQRPQNERPMRPFPQPQWLGQTHQTVLLYAEQGFGDNLQFLRYLPAVLARHTRVLLELPRPLLRLAQSFSHQLQADITILAEGDPLPAFDAHSPLMSLPLALAGDRGITIPPALRFTPPAPPRAPGQLRVGLAWAGNPRHPRDRERSIPAAALLPLFNLPHIHWVSLQTGPAASRLNQFNLAIEQPPLTDFLDTAAVLDTLDLVLSVDTVVAHLAATQGTPIWILLPYVAEWRWQRPQPHPDGVTGNPWYPAARLFRQSTLPDGRPQTELWAPLITNIASALQSLSDGIEANALR